MASPFSRPACSVTAPRADRDLEDQAQQPHHDQEADEEDDSDGSADELQHQNAELLSFVFLF